MRVLARLIRLLAYVWLSLVLVTAALLLTDGDVTTAGVVLSILGAPALLLLLIGRRVAAKGSFQPAPSSDALSVGAHEPPFLKGDGKYEQEVVGESHYQADLAAVAGSKSARSKRVHCSAVLILEDNNPHDKNAVAVLVERRPVGHLPRVVAPTFRRQLGKLSGRPAEVSVEAQIVGGWKDEGSEGHFGIWLDLAWPLQMSEGPTLRFPLKAPSANTPPTLRRRPP